MGASLRDTRAKRVLRKNGDAHLADEYVLLTSVFVC